MIFTGTVCKLAFTSEGMYEEEISRDVCITSVMHERTQQTDAVDE